MNVSLNWRKLSLTKSGFPMVARPTPIARKQNRRLQSQLVNLQIPGSLPGRPQSHFEKALTLVCHSRRPEMVPQPRRGRNPREDPARSRPRLSRGHVRPQRSDDRLKPAHLAFFFEAAFLAGAFDSALADSFGAAARLRSRSSRVAGASAAA